MVAAIGESLSEPSTTQLQPIDTRLWAVAHAIGWIARKLIFRQHNSYLAPLPPTGPYLLLGNHAAALDPVVMTFGVPQPIHFMASEQLFRIGRLGDILRRMGTFPKAKYARDPESIDHMVALNADGRVVGLFPEGNRTWDGRPGPVLPGLGWLIRKIQGPVVFVRNTTGWLLQPRWARYPRLVPMELEYSEPVTFPEDWSASRIEQEIAQRIAIDPATVKLRGRAWGFRMAHGLPDYLWACPVCFTTDALVVHPKDGDRVDCAACRAAWRVDVMQALQPIDGSPAFTVATAFDAIVAHFGELPTVDPDRFIAEGVALEDRDMGVQRLTESGPEAVAKGPAQLLADRLRVGVGEGAWEILFEDVKAVSIEVENALQVRTASELFQLVPAQGSTLKWNHFLHAHHSRSRPTRRGRKR